MVEANLTITVAGLQDAHVLCAELHQFLHGNHIFLTVLELTGVEESLVLYIEFLESVGLPHRSPRQECMDGLVFTIFASGGRHMHLYLCKLGLDFVWGPHHRTFDFLHVLYLLLKHVLRHEECAAREHTRVQCLVTIAHLLLHILGQSMTWRG